jgi:heme/copper-type cytochrome/quinol oxidase subunit 4
MSQLHQVEHPVEHSVGHADEHPVDFKSYVRRCIYVFVAVVCTTSLMIYASFLPHYGWPAKVTMIIAIACVNALVVAGSLMHLLSEKKAIYTTLAFTVFFFAGLMGLTMWAMHDFPTGTQTH